MKIAVLGTGAIGGPMARRLVLAGHDVRVWDPSAAAAIAVTGAFPVAAPADAARVAQVVITLFESEGATGRAAEAAFAVTEDETLWWQAGKVAAARTAYFDDLAAGNGAYLVDGPVLGTPADAERGELTLLAGGPSHALDHLAVPVFGPCVRRIVRVGAAGAATRALRGYRVTAWSP